MLHAVGCVRQKWVRVGILVRADPVDDLGVVVEDAGDVIHGAAPQSDLRRCRRRAGRGLGHALCEQRPAEAEEADGDDHEADRDESRQRSEDVVLDGEVSGLFGGICVRHVHLFL